MKKTYELLFTMILLFIIGLCLLQLTVAISDLHERLGREKDRLDDVRISGAYILSKLRHYDIDEAIEIRENTITIDEGLGYSVCIFCKDGKLYESSVVDGIEHSEETGFVIAEIDSMEIVEEDSTIRVVVADGAEQLSFHTRRKAGRSVTR